MSAAPQVGAPRAKRQSASGVRTLLTLFVHVALIAPCVAYHSVPKHDEDNILRYLVKGIDFKLETTKLRRQMKRDVSELATPPPSPPSSSSSSPSSPSPSSSSVGGQPAAVVGGVVCPLSCRGVKRRPLCASDGMTYSSKCELRNYRDCDGAKELRVVSKGRCLTETKCQEERRNARYDLLQRPLHDIYMPECKPDGSYTQTQCHNATGYCWCVRPDGKPIPRSSVEGQNTNCQRTGMKLPRKPVPSKHRRGIGGCSPYGRSLFNQNLLRRFNEEYARAPRPTQQTTASSKNGSAATNGSCHGDPISPSSSPASSSSSSSPASSSSSSSESCGGAVHRRGVIEWKFSELDVDGDSQLQRKELKTLRYLVNKIVEPHACALSFLDYCDWDDNKRISLGEWTKCLRVAHSPTNATTITTTTSSSSGQQSSNSKRKGGGGGGSTTAAQKPSGDRNLKPGSSRPQWTTNNRATALSHKRIKARIPLKATFYDLKSRTEENQNAANSRNKVNENEEKDSQTGQSPSDAFRLQPCDDERKKAKAMDRADPDGHIFIPECEPNGHFKKAQCHNSTGYCWCVDEKTGMPIPGISTHNVTPDCSEVKVHNLKGCPFVTKKRFLEELLDHITQEMVDRANNETSVSQLNEPDPNQSIEERAVRWKLAAMDSNHNGILEKGEVKNFREEIKLLKGEEKHMRKCRRNFLQYCDGDEDSKITMAEWVACLGLNEQQKSLPENPKRIGKNPFSTVLKS